MRHLESQFQQAVVRYLKLNHIFCFSVPNGTKLKITQARIAKAEGMTAGVSDLIVLLPNAKCVFVELKNPERKWWQSPAQKEFEQKAKSLGFEYYIWDNWDIIEKQVLAWRFIRGVADEEYKSLAKKQKIWYNCVVGKLNRKQNGKTWQVYRGEIELFMVFLFYAFLNKTINNFIYNTFFFKSYITL